MEQGKLLLGDDDMIDTYLLGSRAEIARSLAVAVANAGDEWDRDCSAAYEVGLFDVPRNAWIANEIAKELARWEAPKPILHRYQIREALVAVGERALEDDADCGLQDHMMEEFVDDVIGILKLEVQE